ncbi:two-component system histidine kinase PnpS [Schinkia sp. CFF1]
MVTVFGILLGLTLPPDVDSVIKSNPKHFWAIPIVLGIVCILFFRIRTKFNTHFVRPIQSATMAANELAKGNYKERIYEGGINEPDMLAKSINILARNLEQVTTAHEMQQDRLQTLIESMGSGLILIDGKGYIILVNRYFKDIFDVNTNEYLDRLYYEAFEHREINALIEQIFMTEKSVRKQLYIPLKIERRHFEVYGAPIIGANEEWKGVVLVLHDITELKKLEKMRKDFVANVSHELKTPMTSIRGFTETLLDGALEDKQMSEYFLNIILKETGRLQSLINDLLDLSHIEQEGFTLNISKVNVKQLLEEVMVILQSKAEEKHITFQSYFELENPIVEGDLYRLKQIFINLINNSLNYTSDHGEVRIHCIDMNDKHKVTISDTGIGINKEEIPRIFERFYRVDKARSRNSGGTGLGLAIVKHLVEAHHGKIEVTSEVNKGTTFSVILPKEQINK